MKIDKGNHPLMKWRPECIGSVRQWLEEWNQATLAERMRELLFVGFNVSSRSTEEQVNRLKHYLAVAEDHTGNAWIFSVAPIDDHEYHCNTVFGRKKMHELRPIIAQKAFEMLCLKFFKNESQSEHDRPSWIFLMSREEVLKSILYFFRLESRNSRSFVNLSHSMHWKNDHRTQIAVDFLCEFISSAWPVDESHARVSEWWDSNSLDMFRNYYPNFVDILHGLGRLRLLLERYANVDKTSLARLKELALAGGEYKTIEEAIFNGSQAATVFHLLEVIKKEGRRQEEIQQAKQLATEATRKLKQLNA